MYLFTQSVQENVLDSVVEILGFSTQNFYGAWDLNREDNNTIQIGNTNCYGFNTLFHQAHGSFGSQGTMPKSSVFIYYETVPGYFSLV